MMKTFTCLMPITGSNAILYTVLGSVMVVTTEIVQLPSAHSTSKVGSVDHPSLSVILIWFQFNPDYYCCTGLSPSEICLL